MFDYCEEDVRKSSELFRRQVTGYRDRAPVDVERVLSWSEYSAKAVARIQARGMPIDMPLWNLVQENKAAVVTALIQRFDPSYIDGAAERIYTIDGEWSDARFEQWLVHAGIPAWPRLASGKIQIDSDAFRMMYPAHIRRSRVCTRCATRWASSCGRGFRSAATAATDHAYFRSAPPPGAMRRPNQSVQCARLDALLHGIPEGSIAVYLDWRTQEIGVAAARSGDEQLTDDYSGGDIYHALALMCGLTNDTDIKRWKAEQQPQRQRMKALQLGISYGMGVRSLSSGLDRHPLIASEVILRHKQRYPQFWEWRAERVQRAMLERQDGVRIRRLADASEYVAEQANALQFSDAIRRRFDAAIGRGTALRSRPRAEHAGA